MRSKKRILVVCPFPQGVAAGQRLKYEQYFDNWRENKYEVLISAFMDSSMWEVVYTRGNFLAKLLGVIRGYYRRLLDVFRLSQFDVVYIFMWVTPLGSSFFERIFRRLSKKVIYDIEDNILIEKSNEFNRFIKIMKSQEKAKYLVKTADHVITSSPFLNDYCLRMNCNEACTYISSSVDTERFFPVNCYENNGEKITIGWTGTFSSKVYLDSLRSVFLELNKRVDYKLCVIGNFDYDFPSIDLEVVRWTRGNEVKDLQRLDIGIYPLLKDEWVMGKSGLKAIQYMAFGLPTVATRVGTSQMIIKHMENGWLVDSDEEWVHALETLVKNPQLRRSMGREARRTVVQTYSTQVIKSAYLLILNKLTAPI